LFYGQKISEPVETHRPRGRIDALAVLERHTSYVDRTLRGFQSQTAELKIEGAYEPCESSLAGAVAAATSVDIPAHAIGRVVVEMAVAWVGAAGPFATTTCPRAEIT
jgi:hypothetical protein